MKVKQNKIDDTTVRLEVVATADEVNNALNAAKIAFAQSMGMKPPTQGADIDEEAEKQMGIKNLDSIVEASAIDALVPLAIDKKNIIPSFPPHATPKSAFKRNTEFKFDVDVSLKPEYELSSYDPVKITVAPFTMDESVVDAQLNQMAEQYTTYITEVDVPADREVSKGDHIKIALEAKENGESLKGLSTDGRTYTVAEGFMPDGFDENILGMKVGETREFTFEGPDFDENFNERTQVVDAKVTVLEFQKEAKPEMNDEWVKNNMPMYKDLSEMRKDLSRGFEQQARMQYDAYVKQVAAQELATRFQGKIADEVYEAMREQLLNSIRMDLQQQGMTWEQFVEQNGGEQNFGMMLMLQIRQMLVQGFALDALFRHEHLSITDEDIEEACRSMNPQINPKALRKQLETAGRGFALRESAERLKANKYLVDHADITVLDPAEAEAAMNENEAASNDAAAGEDA